MLNINNRYDNQRTVGNMAKLLQKATKYRTRWKYVEYYINRKLKACKKIKISRAPGLDNNKVRRWIIIQTITPTNYVDIERNSHSFNCKKAS